MNLVSFVNVNIEKADKKNEMTLKWRKGEKKHFVIELQSIVKRIYLWIFM